MPTADVMRVVLPPAMKSEFQSKCAQQGQKMSERMRQLIAQDLREASPADRLASILQSAERKNRASGLPSLSIDDVDEFISKVREERVAEGLVA